MAALRRRRLHHSGGRATRQGRHPPGVTKLLGEVPQATWDSKTTIYEGDVLLLGWGAEGGGNRIEDGIDPSSSATA